MNYRIEYEHVQLILRTIIKYKLNYDWLDSDSHYHIENEIDNLFGLARFEYIELQKLEEGGI